MYRVIVFFLFFFILFSDVLLSVYAVVHMCVNRIREYNDAIAHAPTHNKSQQQKYKITTTKNNAHWKQKLALCFNN